MEINIYSALKKDFEYIKEDVNKKEAFEKSKYEYKMHIKKKVRDQVFTELKVTQDTHSKVREIQNKKFKIQEYMITPHLTNQEVSLLFSVRKRTLRTVVNNFGKKIYCVLGCSVLKNQEHWLVCSQTLSNKNTEVVYSDLYGSLEKQVQLVKLYSLLETEREALTLREAPSSPVAESTGQ